MARASRVDRLLGGLRRQDAELADNRQRGHLLWDQLLRLLEVAQGSTLARRAAEGRVTGMPRKLAVVRDGYDPVARGARCDLCPLRGNNIVPPQDSRLPTKIVFVGEAPGRKEEIAGVPFVGMTGTYLRGLLREVDIDVREAYLQNSALCRSDIDKENEEAAVCCAPRLLTELAELDPSIPIVTLGKTSTLSVLG